MSSELTKQTSETGGRTAAQAAIMATLPIEFTGPATVSTCSPLVAILRDKGSYEVVWEIAKWMETELADSHHRKDVSDHLRECAYDLKCVAQKMLM